MLTLLLLLIVCSVVGNIFAFSFRATWGIIKLLLTLVFLPVIIIGGILAGAISLILPVLILVGIVYLIAHAVRSW